jgi:hypothetical protein
MATQSTSRSIVAFKKAFLAPETLAIGQLTRFNAGGLATVTWRPAPFGPRSAMNTPGAALKLTPSTARIERLDHVVEQHRRRISFRCHLTKLSIMGLLAGLVSM